MKKVQLDDNSISWSATIEEYCRAASEIVRKILEFNGTQNLKVFSTMACKRLCPTPYRPEMDVMKVLGYDIQYIYLQLIGVIKWAMELGRIGIIPELSI